MPVDRRGCALRSAIARSTFRPVLEFTYAEILNMARSDEVERSLCNWWRLQLDTPFPLEQVLESLIIIHDELSPELLINAYWCATDDFKAKDADFAAAGPREAFGRVVSSRGARLRRVYQKRTPLEADFYLPA
jgi:hypothetical protein